jgi:hypothetical protein
LLVLLWIPAFAGMTEGSEFGFVIGFGFLLLQV